MLIEIDRDTPTDWLPLHRAPYKFLVTCPDWSETSLVTYMEGQGMDEGAVVRLKPTKGKRLVEGCVDFNAFWYINGPAKFRMRVHGPGVLTISYTPCP